MRWKRFSLKRYAKWVLPLIILLALTEGAAIVCKANFTNLYNGVVNGIGFFSHLFPPDWGAFADMLEPAGESIVIAFLGTFFGSLLSVVFALLAASNLNYAWVRNTARFLIGVERSVPEIIILLLMVAAFGMGAMPGVVALSLGCIGMLGKLLADVIEEVDQTMIDSMESVGANKLQVIAFGVLPQIVPNIISYTLFRFEINIRLSIILGAVGAGGIGYQLDYAFGMLQYHTACTAMIIVILMVFGTERMSHLLRKKFKMEGALQ